MFRPANGYTSFSGRNMLFCILSVFSLFIHFEGKEKKKRKRKKHKKYSKTTYSPFHLNISFSPPNEAKRKKEKRKKEKREKHKRMQKTYFDQPTRCKAPIFWWQYTTLRGSSILAKGTCTNLLKRFT